MHLLSVFSLRNRALIALVTIVIGVFGGISLTLLKQELIPSLTFPRLFIVSVYPGASPAVVEADVSTPIEAALQTIPGLESTSATSSSNFSNVSASFAYGTNLATAEQKVLSAINRLSSQLPDGVDPQVLSFSLSDLPILQIAVSSDLSAVELSDQLDRIAVPELQRLDGVGNVSVGGLSTERVAITPDAAQLFAAGLSTQAIRDALDANGVLPSTVRVARSVSTLCLMEPMEMKKDMIVDVLKPIVRDREAFRVVGLSVSCSFEDTSAIPGLWHSFNAREDDVAGVKGGAAYGVCYDSDETGQFRYLAGVEARGSTEGMDHVDVPAGRYAVFSHTGHVSDLPKTVYTIWNKSLPDLGLEPIKAPDFERYDDRFDPESGRGTVEIWIPIS